MSEWRIGILGATGLVGQEMIATLEQRKFPVSELRPLASERSAGETVQFHGEEIDIQVADENAFNDLDIVLSSAGGSVSKALLPAAAKAGAVSIDNTSAFRMDPEVPLVVPEVNPHRVADYGAKRIIANPNCSTIQLVLALKPLHDKLGLERVLVSTYQSTSGAGKAAIDDLFEETRSVYTQEPYQRQKFPKRIAFNVLAQIDVFLDDGDTKEEWKMRVETPKILEAEIPLHATCARVPVFFSHAEAVWVQTVEDTSPEQLRTLFAQMPGVEVLDDPDNDVFPTPVDAAGTDPTYIGRIRRDPTHPRGFAFWVVADNIRKGAALNAVQIAERLATHWDEHGHA